MYGNHYKLIFPLQSEIGIASDSDNANYVHCLAVVCIASQYGSLYMYLQILTCIRIEVPLSLRRTKTAFPTRTCARFRSKFIPLSMVSRRRRFVRNVIVRVRASPARDNITYGIWCMRCTPTIRTIYIGIVPNLCARLHLINVLARYFIYAGARAHFIIVHAVICM